MQIKVGATLYPFPSRPLELGEQRRLKREYGWTPGADLNLDDPDHVAALLYAAMYEANPEEPAQRRMSRIDRIRDIAIVGDDGQPITESADDSEPDPTPLAEKDESALT